MREIIKLRGQKTISTLNGNISLNQNEGSLVVKRNGVELTRVDARGFIYSNQDGVRQILIGANPKNGKVRIYNTKDGVDVIDELER